MIKREQTRPVYLRGIKLGGQSKVLIQSMASRKTSHLEEVIPQINECQRLGCDIMRLSVLDEDDAKAFKDIRSATSIPLVADIHFDYRLALLALENGADAIRINPGNIGSEDRVKAVVDSCKAHNAPIRIGVNSGSLDRSIYQGKDTIKSKYLVESAKKHVAILEKFGFEDIVISLKGSDAIETIESYKLASEVFPYPLHLGITESGPKDIGLLRSAAGLSPLLLSGIGDTIRISLSEDPQEEVKACCRLLHDLRLYDDYPTFISCPTCGRTDVDLIPTAKAIEKYLSDHKIAKTIAVMGCVVNGPGEARHADLGCAGGRNGRWVIFKKGEVILETDNDHIVSEMIRLINAL